MPTNNRGDWVTIRLQLKDLHLLVSYLEECIGEHEARRFVVDRRLKYIALKLNSLYKRAKAPNEREV
jgi:hypothetical protein